MTEITNLSLSKHINLPESVKLETSKPNAPTLPVFSNGSLNIFSKVYPDNQDNTLSTSTLALKNHVRDLNNLDTSHRGMPIGLVFVMIGAALLVAGVAATAGLAIAAGPLAMVGAMLTVAALAILVFGSFQLGSSLIDGKKLKKLEKSPIAEEHQQKIKAFIEMHGKTLKQKLDEELLKAQVALEAAKPLNSDVVSKSIENEIQLINKAIEELASMTKFYEDPEQEIDLQSSSDSQ